MEKQFDSLDSYISLAKKTISKFAPKFYNGLSVEMLKSEEAISDVATALMDAEPLKEKTSDAVLFALKKIYARKILDLPYKLITDSGGEFQGKVSDYMKKEKVNTRTAQTGRHRQVAMVERKNQLLGKVLFMKMHARELLTGKLIRDWTKDLPDIIERINDTVYIVARITPIYNFKATNEE